MAGTGDQTYRFVGYTAAVAISRVGLLWLFLYMPQIIEMYDGKYTRRHLPFLSRRKRL